MEEHVKPDAQIGPLKREVPGPAGRSLGPLFPGAQSQIARFLQVGRFEKSSNLEMKKSLNSHWWGVM